jgi:hypothetical protein
MTRKQNLVPLVPVRLNGFLNSSGLAPGFVPIAL